MKRKTWITVLVVIALLAAGAYGFTRWRASKQASTTAPQTSTVQRGDLQAIVSSSGTIRSAQSQDLTFGTSGTVSEVLVEIGDEVKEGQPLAQLDTATLQASVTSAEISLKLAQASLNTLKEPATKTEIANSEATLAKAKLAYDTAKAKPVEWQKAQADATLEAARKTLQDAQDAYDKVSWRPNISMLPQSFTLQSATEAYAKALDTYRIALASISDADIKSAAAALAQAQENYDKLLAGPTEDDLQSAEAQVTQAQLTLDSAKRNLENATLTAPFDGTIASLSLVVGQNVTQSTATMTLVDLKHLETQASIPEVDIVNIQQGQNVDLTLDAYANDTLTGTVSRVALIGTVTQGVVNYPVVVSIDPTTITVKPGMTASISIIVQEHTNVLMAPNRAVHSLGRNQGYYVDVLVEGQSFQVPVTVGMTNGSMTEITGTTLREGDTVIVSSTTAATSSSRIPGFGGGAGFIMNGGGGFPGD
jgi:HlyD family secretion protein